MPLCPQITNTPIPVVLNSDFTVTDVIPVLPATTTQVNTALADAAAALAEANEAYTAAIGSLQPSADTIVNASNQITAINGTGITVYSGASATSGARVVLNSAGLAGFNTGGTATFSISASTGAAVFSGSVTGSTITGGTLNIGGNAIIDSSGFLTATGATITGTITSSNGTIGGFIVGPTYLSTGAGGTGFFINSSSGAGSFNSLTANGNLLANSGLILAAGACTVSAGGNTFNNVGNMNLPTGNLTLTSGRVTTNLLTVDSTATVTGVFTAVDAGTVTNTNTPNAWLSTGGILRRSTASSIRYKENVTDLVNVAELHPKKLLDLPIRAFTYKEDYLSASDDRFQQMFPGFISEEVDAVYPMAVDYENGEIESWNDRILIPGMLALIQDLYKEIATLKGE
jgi:hypothetical protein